MKQVSTFAQRFGELRSKSRYTLEDLQILTGIPGQTLNRYELGKRLPRIDVACRIAECMEVDIRWLLGYDVPKYLYPETRTYLITVDKQDIRAPSIVFCD